MIRRMGTLAALMTRMKRCGDAAPSYELVVDESSFCG
jgi:hypothetical protein